MIYLDNAASTPIDPRVVDEMMPFLTTHYGNASSLHRYGRHARRAIDRAREQVADLINCNPDQIIFTSGGSEANSMVFGGVRSYLLSRKLTHVLVSAMEHKSTVRAAWRTTEYNTQFIPAARHRPMDSSDFIPRTGNNTGLVSLMYVNNETGLINNVSDLCYGLRGHMLPQCDGRTLTHIDCVQAAGHIPVDVKEIGCDFLTLSGHKIHAPKGVGVLYTKRRDILSSIICGGESQEFGIRGGTENVANIVAMGKACEIAKNEMEISTKHIKKLKRTFVDRTIKLYNDSGLPLFFNTGGDGVEADHILSIGVRGVDAQTLVLSLDSAGVLVSAGSACSNGGSYASRTLLALGLNEEEANSTIRVSFSKMNTVEEVVEAAEIISEKARALLGLQKG